jgi:hypothetical protein
MLYYMHELLPIHEKLISSENVYMYIYMYSNKTKISNLNNEILCIYIMIIRYSYLVIYIKY